MSLKYEPSSVRGGRARAQRAVRARPGGAAREYGEVPAADCCGAGGGEEGVSGALELVVRHAVNVALNPKL